MSFVTQSLLSFGKKNEVFNNTHRSNNSNNNFSNKNDDNNTSNVDELTPKLRTSKFNKKLIITYNDELEEEKEMKEADGFNNYIIEDSVQNYTSTSKFLRFNWNGIDFLDRWELQRKVDMEHANELANSMYIDYKQTKEFIAYDPLHLGKKPNDDKFYVLDGQHRLEAYDYFYKLNKYPIQQIPAILWYAKDEKHFIELFHKINSRLSIDKLKLVQIKLLEIFEGIETKYGKTVWGINRPKLNKDIFTDKLKNTEAIHKLTTEEILNKLYKINEKIRGLPRCLRVKPHCAPSIHTSAENMDFFLGLNKHMPWIDEI